MVFSSALFLFAFMPLFFGIYYALPYRFKNDWILIGSAFFYAWGAQEFVLVLAGSITIDFYAAKKLASTDNRKMKQQWLWLSLIANIALLGYFKYANFALENINLLLSSLGANSLVWKSVILPIGISFFTFQKISYVVDVYRGEKPPLHRWKDYALFVVLFPQLIAGPIVRYKELADQIVERRANLNSSEQLLGFFRFAIGLGKKALLANALGSWADGYYNEVFNPTSGEAWFALLAYTFQIYFDFSGYSDMAIGLGRMMGFHFPENFNFPYISQSITEFWRRWHITLSNWMRDYLYIPLGGNRVSSARTYINLWAVFLFSGLWHGASWNFVIWGAYHGAWLVMERAKLNSLTAKRPAFIKGIITFFIAMMGWLLFRIEDWSTFSIYWNAMFSFSGGIDISFYQYTIFALATIASVWPLTSALKRFEGSVYTSLNPLKASIITVVSIGLVWTSAAAIMSTDFNPFIYFRF